MSSPRPTPQRGDSFPKPRSSLETPSGSRSPPSRSPSLRLSQMSSHRQSFSESLRGVPPSPRSQRQSSLSQLYLQELIDNPPARHAADPAFHGRDWRSIQVSELVDKKDMVFVDGSMGIEEATNLLISSSAPILLIRDPTSPNAAISTFDYSDLNAYLLLVVGLVEPEEDQITSFQELAVKARSGTAIPLEDVKDLSRKEPLVKLPRTANLLKAVETFGGGIHRIVVVDEGTENVTGVLSQTRLVRFLWENGRAFPSIEELYHKNLRDLAIGSRDVVSINGDKPLTDALSLLLNTGISSLAVLDNSSNVIGNISTADVKLLTKSSSLPLLQNTCIHFISVVLSTRGMNEGKDSFPVFHVHPQSTLAHTVAKLVATRSHRIYITEPASPLSSGPPTPSSHPSTAGLISLPSHSSSTHSLSISPPSPSMRPTVSSPPAPSSAQPHVPSAPLTSNTSSSAVSAVLPPAHMSPLPGAAQPSVPASALPGARISGHLMGLVSLTDILNLFAKATGLHPGDPGTVQRERRRSSSSVRRSVDLSSLNAGRRSVDLKRG